MVSTRVGYAGGRKQNPTYHDLGDHAETIQIDFDPERITYRELLDVFWSSHNPCGRPWSRQYMSAVFTHDAEQARLARETGAAVAARRGAELHTLIEPLDVFYLAEGYHQKYQLRRLRAVASELEAIYPELDDFVRSTAATRLNAFAGGDLSRVRLETFADQLGLSEAALGSLLE